MEYKKLTSSELDDAGRVGAFWAREMMAVWPKLSQSDLHFLNGIIIHASEKLGFGVKVMARKKERTAREFDWYEARSLGFLKQMEELGVASDELLAIAPITKQTAAPSRPS